MSHEAMTSFMENVARDAGLADALRDAVAQTEGPEAVAAVAGVAAAAGYDVTAEDASAFRTQALDILNDGELSEEKLAGVSGGVVAEIAIAGSIAAVAGMTALPAAGIVLGVGEIIGGPGFTQDIRDKVGDFFSKW